MSVKICGHVQKNETSTYIGRRRSWEFVCHMHEVLRPICFRFSILGSRSLLYVYKDIIESRQNKVNLVYTLIKEMTAFKGSSTRASAISSGESM